MIEIVRANQTEKTDLLFDMHRMRARVFRDMLKWNVHVNEDGLEIDDFDFPDTLYILALDDDQRVIGSWRLLPTSGPTMIRKIWPQYLDSLPMPSAADVWEVSRFAVNPRHENADEALRQSKQAIGEMFCALTEFCISYGIREVYTLYDARIARVIKKIDCAPYKISEKMPIDGYSCQIGAFKTDDDMLNRLRRATGISASVLGEMGMPAHILETTIPHSPEGIYHAP